MNSKSSSAGDRHGKRPSTFELSGEVDIFSVGVEIAGIHSRDEGFTLVGGPERPIDLDFVEFTSYTRPDKLGDFPGPIVYYRAKNSEYGVQLGIRLFQEPFAEGAMCYSSRDSRFSGSVAYDGDLLDGLHPGLDFTYSKAGGFHIEKLAGLGDSTAEAGKIDYSSLVNKVSQLKDASCGQIASDLMKNLIDTKFSIKHISQAHPPPGASKANLYFSVEGSYQLVLKATGKTIVSTGLPDITLVLETPDQFNLSSLKHWLGKELVRNAESIVESILANPKQLAKFTLMVAGVQVTKKLIQNIKCRQDKNDGTDEDAKEAADEAADDNLDAAEHALSEAESIDADATPAEAIAGAIPVFGASLVVAGIAAAIDVFVKFFDFIKDLFTSESPAKKKNSEAKKVAQQARDRAEHKIASILDRVRLDLKVENGTVKASWSGIAGDEGVKYSLSLYGATGERIATGEGSGSEREFPASIFEVWYSTHPEDLGGPLRGTVEAEIEIHHAHGESLIIKGSPQAAFVPWNVTASDTSTVSLKSSATPNQLTVSWDAVASAAGGYRVEVWQVALDAGGMPQDLKTLVAAKPVNQAALSLANLDTPATLSAEFYPDVDFKPDIGGVSFAAKVICVGQPATAEFSSAGKISDSAIYRLGAASVEISYDPETNSISAQWSPVARCSGGYALEVVQAGRQVLSARVPAATTPNSQGGEGDAEGSPLTHLFHLDSEDAHYAPAEDLAVRVQAMGGNAAPVLDSPWSPGHALPVAGTPNPSLTYDPGTNALTMTWAPVPGASRYLVRARKNGPSSPLLSPTEVSQTSGGAGMLAYVLNLDELDLHPADKVEDFLLEVRAMGTATLADSPWQGRRLKELPSPSKVSYAYTPAAHGEPSALKISWQGVPGAANYGLRVMQGESVAASFVSTNLSALHSERKGPGTSGKEKVTYTHELAVSSGSYCGTVPLVIEARAFGSAAWVDSPYQNAPVPLPVLASPMAAAALKMGLESGKSSTPGDGVPPTDMAAPGPGEFELFLEVRWDAVPEATGYWVALLETGNATPILQANVAASESPDVTHTFPLTHILPELSGGLSCRIQTLGNPARANSAFLDLPVSAPAPPSVALSYSSQPNTLLVEWPRAGAHYSNYRVQLYQEATVGHPFAVTRGDYDEATQRFRLPIQLDGVPYSGGKPLRAGVSTSDGALSSATTFAPDRLQVLNPPETITWALTQNRSGQSSQLMLIWTPVPGAKNYEIRALQDGSLAQTVAFAVSEGKASTSKSKTDTLSGSMELKSARFIGGGDIYIEVRGLGNDATHLIDSPFGRSTTPLTPLKTPELREPRVEGSTLTASWEAADHAIGYWVGLFPDGAKSAAVGHYVEGGNCQSYSFDIRTLQKAGTDALTVGVQAVGSGDYANSGMSWSRSVPIGPPTLTLDPLAYDPLTNTLTLSWDQVPGYSRYVVEIFQDGYPVGSPMSPKSSCYNSTTGKYQYSIWLDRVGYAAGTELTVRVSTSDGARTGPPATSASAVLGTLRLEDIAFVSLQSERGFGTRVTPAWNQVEMATGYLLKAFQGNRQIASSHLPPPAEPEPGRRMTGQLTIEPDAVLSDAGVSIEIQAIGNAAGPVIDSPLHPLSTYRALPGIEHVAIAMGYATKLTARLSCGFIAMNVYEAYARGFWMGVYEKGSDTPIRSNTYPLIQDDANLTMELDGWVTQKPSILYVKVQAISTNEDCFNSPMAESAPIRWPGDGPYST